MSHKLGICIPYRDRLIHLKQLVPHLTKLLTEKGIDHKFYVAHQVDDKLLNRGALKNIAAKYALEDGCDYIAWHDVDMLSEDCDYSYPGETPLHIATHLSKYNYGIGYDQYFGGIVLFTKEQIEKTNGYSNGYWDWGQEDDDLFWRCYFEGYTTGKILQNYSNRRVAVFNGEDSFLSLPSNETSTSYLNDDHQISILFKPYQQPEKTPIWLIGDKDRKFVEYPLLRKKGENFWGLSFNNSRSITMMATGESGTVHYNWGKRFENLWTTVTMLYSKKLQKFLFYINNELIAQLNGTKKCRSFYINENLKRFRLSDFIVGYCKHTGVYYKGLIAEIKITSGKELVLHYDFNDGFIDKISGRICENHNVKVISENVDVIENILPYRRQGRVVCLPHTDEGYSENGWIKGETTARNEKRLVTEMQQKKIDYKNEGFNSLKYTVKNTEMIYNNCLMINVEL